MEDAVVETPTTPTVDAGVLLVVAAAVAATTTTTREDATSLACLSKLV
jgi:hypothetical protein